MVGRSPSNADRKAAKRDISGDTGAREVKGQNHGRVATFWLSSGTPPSEVASWTLQEEGKVYP